jgi:hypothetical protein
MDLDGCALEDAFSMDFEWLDKTSSPKSSGASCIRPETAATQSRKNERKKAAKCRSAFKAGTGSTFEESDRNSNSNDAYYKSGQSLLGNSSERSEEDAYKEIPENSPVHRLKALAKMAKTEKADALLEDFQDGLKTTLPIIQKMKAKTDAETFESGVPAYFGADPSDDGATTKKLSIAPFVDYIEDEDTYNFNNADYTKTFNGLGFDKASGAPLKTKGLPFAKRSDFLAPIHEEPSANLLSEPSLLGWKGKDKGLWTNQFGRSYVVPESTRETEALANQRDLVSRKSDQRALMEKMDAIYSRLDQLEKGSPESAQTETLLFVMSGLGLIFFLDLACRTASKMK